MTERARERQENAALAAAMAVAAASKKGKRKLQENSRDKNSMHFLSSLLRGRFSRFFHQKFIHSIKFARIVSTFSMETTAVVTRGTVNIN